MPAVASPLDSLLSLSGAQQAAILNALSNRDATALLYDWYGLWARPEQRPPASNWRVWLVMAGRGFGKTRTGAEWIRSLVEPGICGRLAMVAPTAADARDVMVEGESGVLAISPDNYRPVYEPSKRRLTWPNGAMATMYSADEPDRLRGPQHDGAWGDEIAAWRYPETWDMLMFGLRLGPNPRALATTTPRPVKLVRDLLSQPTTTITRGSTFANRDNLAPAFLSDIISRYEGTRLGRQELHGELLDDIPGALWLRSMFDTRKPAPPMSRVVVAVDPAVTSSEGADETGIVAAGRTGRGAQGEAFVLADRSLRASPDGWARTAVRLYYEYAADRIVAEKNNGGEMVEHTIHTVDARVPVTLVHASRGKYTRAEPVAALYEQQRVWHTAAFDALEDQLVNWTPDSGDSPDRLDALVWAITDLMLDTTDRTFHSWS